MPSGFARRGTVEATEEDAAEAEERSGRRLPNININIYIYIHTCIYIYI